MRAATSTRSKVTIMANMREYTAAPTNNFSKYYIINSFYDEKKDTRRFKKKEEGEKRDTLVEGAREVIDAVRCEPVEDFDS